jgi:hypothetical protein
MPRNLGPAIGVTAKLTLGSCGIRVDVYYKFHSQERSNTPHACQTTKVATTSEETRSSIVIKCKACCQANFENPRSPMRVVTFG